jgi:hypothetical protein
MKDGFVVVHAAASAAAAVAAFVVAAIGTSNGMVAIGSFFAVVAVCAIHFGRKLKESK